MVVVVVVVVVLLLLLLLSPLSVFVVVTLMIPTIGHQDLAEGPGIWIRDRKTSSTLSKENVAK